MNEIYWITRLDYIQGAIITFTVILGIIILILSTIWYTSSIFYPNDEDCNIGLIKRDLKIIVPSFIISIMLLCAIPNTKEALIIYGIGGSIDYIKNNNNVKKLPDKVIYCLEKYLDDEINKKCNKAKTK